MKNNTYIWMFIMLTGLTRLCAQPADTMLYLSVEDCIAKAWNNDATLKNSRLEVQKAQMVKNAVLTEYFPTISARALAFHAVNPLLHFTIDDIDNAMVRQVLNTMVAEYGYLWGYKNDISLIQHGTIGNIMLTEPLYAGGRIYNGNKLAQLGMQAAQYQQAIKKDEVRLQVECLYWQIISLQEKTATLNELDVLLDSLEKSVKEAVAAGLIMPNDQYKVSLKKNESALNRKKVSDGIVLLKMALALYIGENWQCLHLTDTLPGEMEYIAEPVLAANAVAARNESMLLNIAVQAEKLKKKMTLGAALPSLMIGGSVSGHTLFNNPKCNALAFAMLQIPITDWHKASYNLKKHNYDIQIADNNRDYYMQQMNMQTEQAWFNVQQSELRIHMARTAVEEAQANYKMENDYYNAGMVAVSDLLEAHTLLKQAKDELTDSRIEYRINCVKYRQLTE